MKTKRRSILTLVMAVGLALVSALAPAHAADGKKPNILVIWGDDIGHENVNAYSILIKQ